MLLGEQTTAAFIDGLIRSGAGPEWFFFVLLLVCCVLLAWKGFLPIYERKIDAEIDLEKQREERKDQESKSRERRDIERSKMEGRWIEQMERSVNVQAETNQINEAIRAEMESLRVQNKALTDAIQESREGSKTMFGKLDAISDFIKKENK